MEENLTYEGVPDGLLPMIEGALVALPRAMRSPAAEALLPVFETVEAPTPETAYRSVTKVPGQPRYHVIRSSDLNVISATSHLISEGTIGGAGKLASGTPLEQALGAQFLEILIRALVILVSGIRQGFSVDLTEGLLLATLKSHPTGLTAAELQAALPEIEGRILTLEEVQDELDEILILGRDRRGATYLRLEGERYLTHDI